jgi:hypothetical protein
METESTDAPDVLEDDFGVTRVLTDEGWEDATYVDPEDDWLLLEDGSWTSPDGRIRSWPALGPEPRSETD